MVWIILSSVFCEIYHFFFFRASFLQEIWQYILNEKCCDKMRTLNSCIYRKLKHISKK